jgi:hypothetical protein
MSDVDHPHVFEHEESIESAGGGQGGSHIGAHRAKLTHKRVPFQGAWEEEATGEVAVAGAKGRSNPDTS